MHITTTESQSAQRNSNLDTGDHGFAQDDKSSRKSERMSELLLSLFDTLSRQPLAQSPPLLRRALERTHRSDSVLHGNCLRGALTNILSL
jgi:hypothetical protein